MRTAALDARRARLASRLERLSAGAWVREVDRLARYSNITLDAASTLLARRFAGEFLASRRSIAWPMLEYLHVSFEPAYWSDPLRNAPGSARRGAAA